MIPVDLKKEQQSAQREQQQQKRAALVPMIVAMIAVSGAALYVFWEDISQPMPAVRTPGVMIYSEDMGMEEDDFVFADFTPDTELFQLPSLNDMVQVHEADEASSDEPGDLNPPEAGQRLSGYRRLQGGHEQIASVWVLPESTLAQAVTFYRLEAERRGFESLPALAANAAAATDNGPQPVSLRYWLAPPDSGPRMAGAGFGELLTIRLSPQADDIRATLVLIKPVR